LDKLKKVWTIWAQAIGPKEPKHPNVTAGVRTLLILFTMLTETAIMLNVWLNHFNG